MQIQKYTRQDDFESKRKKITKIVAPKLNI